MTKHRDLNYGDRLPEAVTDALMEFISTLLVNFKLSLQTPTTLQVVAGSGNDQVGAGIMGRWRWITATISAAHPGGAAASYDVWVTASDNVFTPSGLPPGSPPEVDGTVYTFALAITATGVPPVGPALNRKIATVQWDGTKITRITPVAGNLPLLISDVVVVAPESAARNRVQASGDFVPLTIRRASNTAADYQFVVEDETGTAIARISENGRVWAAGGFHLPDYTTAQRDALSAARKPTRTVLFNTDTFTPEINNGTGAAPAWGPLGGYGPGIILAFAGDERDAPTRTTTADGHQLSKTTEAGLWNKLSHGGTLASPWDTFGGLPAPSAGNYRVPDLRGRGLVGKKDMGAVVGTSPPTLTGAAVTRSAAGTLGSLIGEEFHTLTIAESASHDHGAATGANSVDHTHTGTTSTPSIDHTHSGTTGGRSAGHTHSIDMVFSSASASIVRGSGAYDGPTSETSGGESTDHTHSFTTGNASSGHTHTFTTGGASVTHTHPITAQGGGGAHENVHPVAVINFVVTLS